jgi:hypothetical protein
MCEPFVEGALFMNHDSNMIVHFLKGQEAGFNRKDEMQRIHQQVDGTGDFWYSDWETPPITQQSQRIMVYDLEVLGSMLAPQNAVLQFLVHVDKLLKRPVPSVYYAAIVAGYTTKTK